MTGCDHCGRDREVRLPRSMDKKNGHDFGPGVVCWLCLTVAELTGALPDRETCHCWRKR
jgi:hypothetical protein